MAQTEIYPADGIMGYSQETLMDQIHDLKVDPEAMGDYANFMEQMSDQYKPGGLFGGPEQIDYTDQINYMGTGVFHLSAASKQGKQTEAEKPEQVEDVPVAPLIRELSPYMSTKAIQDVIARVSQKVEGERKTEATEKPEAEDMPTSPPSQASPWWSPNVRPSPPSNGYISPYTSWNSWGNFHGNRGLGFNDNYHSFFMGPDKEETWHPWPHWYHEFESEDTFMPYQGSHGSVIGHNPTFADNTRLPEATFSNSVFTNAGGNPPDTSTIIRRFPLAPSNAVSTSSNSNPKFDFRAHTNPSFSFSHNNILLRQPRFSYYSNLRRKF